MNTGSIPYASYANLIAIINDPSTNVYDWMNATREKFMLEQEYPELLGNFYVTDNLSLTPAQLGLDAE